MRMKTQVKDYNEVDILYTLMSYINVASTQDMHYTIAHQVLTHLDQVPYMSINELADLCFTSPATVSRFCKDMNCSNFASFKKEIAEGLEIASNEIHFPAGDAKMIEENPQKLVTKIYRDTKNSLDIGMNDIDIADIDKICKMIHEAKDVHMVGYQFSKIVCTDFQLKMLKLQKFIYAFINKGDEIQKLETIVPGALVIIVSVGARRDLMDPLIKKLKERQPKILMVTMNRNYTNDDVDEFYYLAGMESDYTQSSMMGSVDLVSLFNVIYVRYGLLYGKK